MKSEFIGCKKRGQPKAIFKTISKKKAESAKNSKDFQFLEANISLQVGQEAVIFSITQKDFSKIISPLYWKKKEPILILDANNKTRNKF